MKPVAVIGAGAFGTALATVIGGTGRPVFLWAREGATVARLREMRESPRLPGVSLPAAVRPITDLREIPSTAALILAVPAQQTGPFLEASASDLPTAPLVLAAKGIGAESHALQTDIAARYRDPGQLAVLSGPGFADEIARGLPTALTLAASDRLLAAQLQDRLSAPTLRLYTTTDIVGVQLGGALKNVIAIACGICAGAGLGDSARAALMTRGFAEIVRLGRALGADPQTFAGLSGLGDLALTCASDRSRNYATGLAIGAGRGATAGITVEGIATAAAIGGLAQAHGVDCPVATTTAAILDGRLTVAEAMAHLLSRPLKEER